MTEVRLNTRVRAYLSERLLPTLLAALLACGLALTLCDSLFLAGGWMDVAAVCAGLALFTLATDWHWAARLAGWVALLMGLSVFALTDARIPGLITAVQLAMQGNTGALALYAPLLRAAVAIAFAALSLVLNRYREGFYPSLSLALVVLMWGWMTGYVGALWALVPALIALAGLYARAHCESTPPLRILAAAGAVVLVALLLLPAEGIKNPRLEALAERIRQMTYDYLFFNEPRTIYTIQYDGFQPLGNRLGGPIQQPSQRQVMEVTTPTTLLLRGISKDSYTGKLWQDTLSARRYLYVDPRWRGLRNSLLDSERPAAALRQGALFESVEATVRILDHSATTLFVPHRLTQLRCAEDMVPYFNSTGELFITRDLTTDDVYSVAAPLLSLDAPGLAGVLAQAEAHPVADLDASMLAAYAALPDGIEEEVYALVRSLTQGKATDLEKLVALRDHLYRNYAYTLTPAGIPPEGRDFVSYFLREGKEGYCTYFASAMAVMARIAGIPTRYVEGFLAVPDASGVAHVTGENAHAWVEAYLDHFGWISIDATPPESLPQEDPGEGDTQQETGGTPEDEGDTPLPSEPSPSPEPEGEAPDPTPSPSPSPSPQPSDNPSPSPDPPDEEDTQETADPTDDSDDRSNAMDLSFLWRTLLALLALLLLCAGVWLRWRWTCPARAARRRKDDAERLLVWYRAALRLLAASGMPATPEETPGQLAVRAPQLKALMNAVSAQMYGRKAPEPEVFEAAENGYEALWDTLPRRAKFRAVIRQMLHGVGDLKRIP